MTAAERVEFDNWTESDLRAWLVARDYRALLHEPICAPGLPIIERFDWRGLPIDPGFRRIRVMARQVYVLCHAALGGNNNTHQLASVAVKALVERGVGPEGQFHCRLAPDGGVLDPTPDLYDIAFGLFAMAWWYRLSGDEEAIEVAERSVEHLCATMTGPLDGAFFARADKQDRLEQNPHMHLFEAATFLTAFTRRPAFAELARDLFHLAENVLFDNEMGTLPELFEWGGRPLPENGSVCVEPGHHYEWVWLLHRYAQLDSQPRAYALADRLFDFARRHGHDQVTGLAFDAIDQRGRPIATDLRIWPNTEFLKAQVAMQERYGEGPGFDDAAIMCNIKRIRDHFLTPQHKGPAAVLREGWWIDHLEGSDLQPKSNHIPASTLYHIFFGFTELLRHRAGHDAFSGLPW